MKKGRKMLCMIMATVTALSMSVSASAESVADDSVLTAEPGVTAEPDDDGYVLVSEESYTDENGVFITHRSYIKNTGISTCDTYSSGEADIREEADYTVNGTYWATIWVKGHFKWDSKADTSTVTLLDHGCKTTNSTNISLVQNSYPVTKNNQGGAWGGKKYSYIEKKIKMKTSTPIGISNGEYDFRLYVDVNVNGEKKVKT
ncbi:MAG: hypothetical protein K2N38_02990 [Oscillospiraceae bacterium]|nr:hypothetical protein [Oscillospiraceae bacterium]